ncbi:MAG TPA: AraC family transcriptional regulator [Chthoniobacterales bacterium]|nr:AraC family transcriptional regulator [Chthoniobacterales bacterium]
MQILKTKAVIYDFHAVELNQIVPEVVDLGDDWESPGSQEDRHQHRYWELGYAAEGTSELHVGGGRRFHLSAGSFWSVGANTEHWLRRGTEARHRRLFVGLQLPAIVARHSEWNLRNILRAVVVLHEVYQFEYLFSRIVAEGANPSHYQAAALRLSVDALLLEIIRAGTDRDQKAANAVMHPAVSRALNLLQTRFRENWPLDRLASESGISRARLAQLFSREIGTSIHKVLNKVRVERAQALLKDSDLSISEIASDCGFATSQHFARIFRQLTGSTAGEYRRVP